MTATTNTQSIETSVSNESYGKIVQDATAAAALALTLGFNPRYFALHNITDRISYEWFEGMTNPGALKTVAAGTRTLETTEGPTFGTAAAGTLGVVTLPATLMLASKTYQWVARG